ncbi:hypothetical protein HED60_14115 [Planctomycetales bacterium ZRK34]|nr:hypothetical protein HED60_14115 [Planctomycetales bacterium ZRK34]
MAENSNTNGGWEIQIDDSRFRVDDPVLTGRQLLNLAEKRPVEEHLVYFLDRDRLMEDIALEESVDLRPRGIERFFTFHSDRSFRFELDGRRQDWGVARISEAVLRRLAGVGTDYNVWLERRGEEDRLLERGEIVCLDEPGVERFYTGRDDTTAGFKSVVLPTQDRRYLEEHGLEVEDVANGAEKGVVFKQYPVPADLYDTSATDVLIILPAGYPDTAPDMFFCNPWLKLRNGGKYPNRADAAHMFAGRRWQRWSRHNSIWRPGVDGMQTMLRRIDRALRGK